MDAYYGDFSAAYGYGAGSYGAGNEYDAYYGQQASCANGRCSLNRRKSSCANGQCSLRSQLQSNCANGQCALSPFSSYYHL